MDDFELRIEFTKEAREYIDHAEPLLIELLQDDETTEAADETLINDVFRLFHSIKGSAGFLQLGEIAGLTHEAETVLDRIRMGDMRMTTDVIRRLCDSIDLLREMIDHIEDGGDDEQFSNKVAEQSSHLSKLYMADTSHDPAESNSLEETIATDESSLTSETLKSDIETHGENQPLETPDEIQVEAQVEVEIEQTIEMSESDEELPPPLPPLPDSIDITDEMRVAFCQESFELLDMAEQAMLEVINKPSSDNESLFDVLRSLHSFKGNCAYMGLNDLCQLSHMLETVVGAMRSGKFEMSSTNNNSLLGMVDVLRNGLIDLSEGGSGTITSCDVYLELWGSMLPADVECDTRQVSSPTSTNAAAEEEQSTDTADPKSAAAETPTEQAAEPSTTPETPTEKPVEANATSEIPAKQSAAPAETSQAKSTTTETSAKEKLSAPKTPVAETKAKPTEPSRRASDTSAKQSQSPPPARRHQSQDIRVDLMKLDKLINLVGELVIAESMLTGCPAVANIDDEYYEKAKHQMLRICSDLQDVAMTVRMVPLATTFRKMTRLVHDVSQKAGKRVNLQLIGEGTEVDKTVIERISDPLVHIIRNSCDHGIETPEDRVAAGKPETGTVTIEAKHEAGEVWIIIRDDGRGLAREKILKRAIERGLVSEDDDLPDEHIYRLIFEPGFSTAETVTDISGRGVGMDVVKRNIENLNGRIDVRSQAGQGTSITLRIPLTLAIIDGMLVKVGEEQYTIPTLAIRESLRPTPSQITTVPDGTELLRLREEFIPVIKLKDLFNLSSGIDKPEEAIIVIVEDSGVSIALVVDDIIGQRQTVIKALSDRLGKARGCAGCTILGDGTVSLIIDISGMVEIVSAAKGKQLV